VTITPEQAKKWIALIGSVVVAIGGGVATTVTWAKSENLWGNKLEVVNAYLNQKNVGEESTKTVISTDPKDYRAEFAFTGGDTLYVRSWVNIEGSKQKLKRWTSKTPLDDLYEKAVASRFIDKLTPGNIAYASMIPAFDGEVYVGETEDGLYIYFIPDEDICEFQDAGGAIVKTAPPPCDQYLEQ